MMPIRNAASKAMTTSCMTIDRAGPNPLRPRHWVKVKNPNAPGVKRGLKSRVWPVLTVSATNTRHVPDTSSSAPNDWVRSHITAAQQRLTALCNNRAPSAAVERQESVRRVVVRKSVARTHAVP